MTFLRNACLVLPALLCAACSNASSNVDTGNPVASTVQRDTSPNVPAGDTAKLTSDNTSFGLALYGELAGTGSRPNLFVSPYSVSLALAMTYAGARGTTATEIASALQFDLPSADLGVAFDALDLAIQKPPVDAKGVNGAPFALTVADSLWGDRAVAFAPSYVDTLAADYGASLRTVDFASQPAAAETAINNWVSQETDGNIDPLLGPDAVTTDTKFVIVNAVYFNASWASPFQTSTTVTGAFMRDDGSTVQTALMNSPSAATRYASGSTWEAVELPYAGATTSMVVVLPKPGAFSTVEQSLTGELLSTVVSSLQFSQIDLTLPRFTVKGPTVSLRPALQALGMKTAFTPSADFTGMIPTAGVYISDVLHQAFVDVNEGGTVATAATGVTGIGLSVASPSVRVNVDRAFFFFIRDTSSGSILFAGRESDPTSN